MADRWISPVPEKCDICGRTIGTIFIDGKTNQGPWACMCGECHKHYGYGLGIGRGQKFRKTKTEGGIVWLKVAK